MKSTPSNLWARRHLLGVLVVSNLKRQNKNSALGYLWWLLDPILMTMVYYVLVAVLFKRGGDNQPFVLFIVCGLLPWKAFTSSVKQSISSIRSAKNIIKSISFPKSVLPLSLTLSNTVYFLVGILVASALASLYGPMYGTWPNVYYLMLPVIILIQLLFTVGLCLFFSTMGLFYQDTGNIMNHVLRMWYFLSPGLYSIERVPVAMRPWFRLNPFCELMTMYRDVIMWGRMPRAFDLSYALLVGVISFLIGYAVFRRSEGRFVHKL